MNGIMWTFFVLVMVRVRTTKGMSNFSDPIIAKTLDMEKTELDKLKELLGIPLIWAKFAELHGKCTYIQMYIFLHWPVPIRKV